jgi:hypothetical protein
VTIFKKKLKKKLKKKHFGYVREAVLVASAGTLAACAVTSVDPVVPSREIAMICIDHNPDAGENYDRMTGGAFPGECPHRLQTRVSWSNTLIRYVVSLELEISENNRPLGDATYAVGQAYRTPERLGSAASKAKPLLEELLAEYGTIKP